MRPMQKKVQMAVVFATTVVASVGTLAAQVTEVARKPIADVTQLTFGSLCDDKFVIRNDGPNPVNLEYAVQKGTEHTRLTLNGRELVELESKSREPMELWMDGKLIAKAEKERRSCRDVQGSATVGVAPLDVPTNDRAQRQNNVGFGYSPFYDPWGYGFNNGFYNGFGFRPFYSGFYGRPIIIVGGRGRRR
jgi:hypothetical protein